MKTNNITFILDYSTLIMQSGFALSEFAPTEFNWLLFGVWEAIILYGIGSVIYRTIKKSAKNRRLTIADILDLAIITKNNKGGRILVLSPLLFGSEIYN